MIRPEPTGLPLTVPRSISTVLLRTFASAVRPVRWTATAVGGFVAPMRAAAEAPSVGRAAIASAAATAGARRRWEAEVT